MRGYLLAELIHLFALLGNKLLLRRYSPRVAGSRVLYDLARRVTSKVLRTLLLMQAKSARNPKKAERKIKSVFF